MVCHHKSMMLHIYKFILLYVCKFLMLILQKYQSFQRIMNAA
jgi:hypothetical protein